MAGGSLWFGVGAYEIADAWFHTVSPFGFCTLFVLEQRFLSADVEIMGTARPLLLFRQVRSRHVKVVSRLKTLLLLFEGCT
jgi:hypothetical protein